MERVFEPPDLSLDDLAVIDDIHAMREVLALVLRAPAASAAPLRPGPSKGRTPSRGYTVTDQDAIAAVDDQLPLTADQSTWAEILGYRRVLTYVHQVATEPGFVTDPATIRSMHFMLLEHDLAKSPGRYRTTEIYVRDDKAAATVYQGPAAERVGDLVGALTEALARRDDTDPMVTAAMAHLNLVMIHPFRDGNGRLARALQTLVLSRDVVVKPTFSSIEEWLGSNTDDYYRVLAATGQGSWQPDNDTSTWLKFTLRVHHMQAQTLQRRFCEAKILWTVIDDLVAEHHLPTRTADILFDALQGFRVTRPAYVKRAEVEQRTATRDLGLMVDQGLLTAQGQTRGRSYVAGAALRSRGTELRAARAPLDDPYPHLMGQLRARTP